MVEYYSLADLKIIFPYRPFAVLHRNRVIVSFSDPL